MSKTNFLANLQAAAQASGTAQSNTVGAAMRSGAALSKKARELSELAARHGQGAEDSGEPLDHQQAEDSHNQAAEAHVAAARGFTPGSDEHAGHSEIAAEHAKQSWLHASKHEGRLAKPGAPAAPQNNFPPQPTAGGQAPAPAPAQQPPAPQQPRRPVPPQFQKRQAPKGQVPPQFQQQQAANAWSDAAREAALEARRARMTAPTGQVEAAESNPHTNPFQGDEHASQWPDHQTAYSEGESASERAKSDESAAWTNKNRKPEAVKSHHAASETHRKLANYFRAHGDSGRAKTHQTRADWHESSGNKLAQLWKVVPNESLSGQSDLTPGELTERADELSLEAEAMDTAVAHMEAGAAHLRAQAAWLRAGDGAQAERCRATALRHAERARKLGNTAGQANEQGRDEKGRFTAGSGDYHGVNFVAAKASQKAEQEDTQEAHESAAKAHQAAADEHKIYDKHNTALWEREHHEKAVMFHQKAAASKAKSSQPQRKYVWDRASSAQRSQWASQDRADAAAAAKRNWARANEGGADDAFTFMANADGYRPNEETGLTRVQLAPYGDFPHSGGLQRFEKADADQIVNEWTGLNKAANPVKWMGVPWYIGHPDHPAFKDRYTDTRAYGRIKKLEAGNDGLYGWVKFNDLGKQLVNTEQFHGHSVNWRVRQDGAVWRPFSLKSVGFTNEPNIPVQPVTHANEGEEEAANANPEGINQYTKGGGGASGDANKLSKEHWDLAMKHTDQALKIRKAMRGESDKAKLVNLETSAHLHSGVGEAFAASSRAHGSGTADDHRRAAEAHKEASFRLEKADEYNAALKHSGIARFHEMHANNMGNSISLSDIRLHLQALVAGDARFAKSDPEHAANCVLPAVLPCVSDVIPPDDGGSVWQVVAQCGDGRHWALPFALGNEGPELEAGEPVEVVLDLGNGSPDQPRDEKGRFASGGGGGDELHSKLLETGRKEHASMLKSLKHLSETATDEELQQSIDREAQLFGPSDETPQHRREMFAWAYKKHAAQSPEDYAQDYAKTRRANYGNEFSGAATATGSNQQQKGNEVRLNQLALMVGLPEAANEVEITERIQRVFGDAQVMAFANAAPAEGGQAFPPWTKELGEWKGRAEKAETELGNCMESLKGTVKSAVPAANEVALASCGSMRKAVEDTLANARKQALDAALKAGVVTLAQKDATEKALADDFANTVASLVARKPALQTQSAVNATGAGKRSAELKDGGPGSGAIRELVNETSKAAAKEGRHLSYEEAWAEAKRKNPAAFAN